MILYKYYGYEAGVAALRSKKLGFRQPQFFNDPFELSYFGSNESQKILESVCILSLTRSPLNPLMWAHYGQEHTGFVIGYKVNVEFLTDESLNLIPVHQGDVIYTNTKTPVGVTAFDFHDLCLKAQGAPLHDFQNGYKKRNFDKKLFLSKHTAWAYEEEVRVVKPIDSLFEESADFQSHPFRSFYSPSLSVALGVSVSAVKGLMIFNHEVQIKEVYLGVRNPLRSSLESTPITFDDSLVQEANKNEWHIYLCEIDSSSWNLIPSKVESDYLRLRPKTSGLISNVTLSGYEFLEANRILAGIPVESSNKLTISNWCSQVNVQLNGAFLPRK